MFAIKTTLIPSIQIHKNIFIDDKLDIVEQDCSYYDGHYPHMRSLNAHGTWESDWDPATELMYIVRKDYVIIDLITTFSPDELHMNGIYPYLS